MGVYIKGMEMPCACVFCELYEADLYWCRGAKREVPYSPEDKCAEFCPLVPVPPHGRFGDLDALHKLFLEKAKEYKGVGGAMVAMAALCIANAPTIIEAEEGE